jgi:N-acetylglucosaminyl-diphospho-decaprenol L-rhamnosyltransferase
LPAADASHDAAPGRAPAGAGTGARHAEGSAPTDAAIVLVNYRTPELVERCLASVEATREQLVLETVIVDNGSADDSVQRLRAALPAASVLALSANRGFAAGVNAGLAHTRAEIAIVLNPDTELQPGALQALIAHLRAHPRTGVAAPLLQDASGRLAPNGYRRFPGLGTLALELCIPLGYALVHVPALHPYAMSPAALCAGARPAHVYGAVLAIRRSAYEQAGPLDEGFFLYLEETEFQRRVAHSGWAIEIVPSARALHLVRGGEQAALAPSPHFVTSAIRYLRLRGVPAPVSRAVLALALASSWLALGLIALLPSKRATATLQARAYRSLAALALSGRLRRVRPEAD